MYAGVAQLVERNLAKVEVASSRLVSRSNPQREATLPFLFGLNRRTAAAAAECGYNPAARHLAGWQSGYAAACKAVYAGSIPTSASSCKQNGAPWAPFLFSRAAFMARLRRPDVAGMLHYSCRTLFGGLRGLARGAACQSPSPIRDTPPACPGPLRHFPFFPVPMLLPMVAATVPR
ncbi:hypothetical protein CBM2626_A140225 [Cupriavidus taiwanensis]|nr:hypothetical protein CBM2604_A100077 [Cupriavidus taiwanensis]SOZ44160.1 hypothetical protein CBM2610_A120078 [Cupriavidus taiwanensis]SOZ98128.1 hypothetical protein CBM2626_A140225 [Cupriavidus taiwanensis]